MFYHIILTTECNSQCRYCYGEAVEDFDEDSSGIKFEYGMPKSISYDVSLLDRLCGLDPYCVLTFYGGEPLLCTDQIKQVMDRTRPKMFMIQTNGLLLDRLESSYVNRFHTILVSIDGEETLTDHYRGSGTFRRVVENLKLIRENGFSGELIARMTVMEETDIYGQVRWLLDNDEFAFSSVHWQLNAGFWRTDYSRREFKGWAEGDYDPGIRRLVRFWVEKMEKDGKVLRLYPILGIAESLLSGEREAYLRCGGGWINYAVQTDGKIIPCPAMWGLKPYYLGNIVDVDPSTLPRLLVNEPCSGCTALELCGGRCLYAKVMKRWSPEAYGEVCMTVKNLIDAVSEEMPRVNELLERGRVSFRDFEYVRYNGCEIIP